MMLHLKVMTLCYVHHKQRSPPKVGFSAPALNDGASNDSESDADESLNDRSYQAMISLTGKTLRLTQMVLHTPQSQFMSIT